MSRRITDELASFWPGPFGRHSRDINGATLDAWAAEEGPQRAAEGRHGITEPELRQLLRVVGVKPAVRKRAA